MERKELIAILTLAALVGIAATVRLSYYPPGSARGNTRYGGARRAGLARGAPAVPSQRYLPANHEARALLIEAESIFGYALFAIAAEPTGERSLFKEAVEKYEQFSSRYPSEKAAQLARLRIAQCHTVSQDYQLAAEVYEKFLDLYEDSELRPVALLWGGYSYAKAGQPREARRLFRRITEDRRYQDTPFAEAAKQRLKELDRADDGTPAGPAPDPGGR
ncbi:MAG: tetratricopeptide repeat protein [bacterium]